MNILSMKSWKPESLCTARKSNPCSITHGEIFASGIHISPYEKGNIFNRDPLREKKLLLHRKEINKLFGLVGQKGMTLIPLSIYLKGSLAKVELGVCRGKKLYDKREADAERQAARDIERYEKGKTFD